MPKFRKATFGGVNINRIIPQSITEKTIAVSIPFKDAIYLHFALGDCLLKLNRYNMATRKGQAAAVRLNIYPKKKRLMVLED